MRADITCKPTKPGYFSLIIVIQVNRILVCNVIVDVTVVLDKTYLRVATYMYYYFLIAFLYFMVVSLLSIACCNFYRNDSK